MDNIGFKHSFRTSINENIGLSIYYCGYEKCENNHSWGPAMRDHYLIHYVSKGKGLYNDGNSEYELSAGDIFLASPSKIVFYKADETDPWEYYWVGFSGADSEHLLSAAGFNEFIPVINCKSMPETEAAIIDVYKSNGRTIADEVRMTAKLYLFLALLIENNEKGKQAVTSGYNHFNNAVKYIQHNYSRNIGLDDIAENIGISRSHLYRIFMTHMSMSPNEFLVQYRINRACSLLRDKGLLVSEAAFSTGFNDQLYFSRVFKKYKGVPPSKYLKSIKEDKEM